MLGLVLEGGGAKGSFQVGAIKALLEKGYEFDGVTGTSIGAINGALVAQGDAKLMEELWLNVKPSDVLEVEDDMMRKYSERNFDKDVILYFSRLVYRAVKNGGLSMKRAESLLGKYICEQKIRAAKMDYGLVTVDISDKWKPIELFKEDIQEGELLKYIIASAYFPAFKREPIGGKKYMDGGIYDNMPINPLIRKGYDKIIAIRTLSNMPHQKVIDSSVEVNYIVPSEKITGTLAFTPEKVKRNITLGYYDALRFADGLVGNMYYIKKLSDEQFIAYMQNLPVNVFRAWSEILDIHGSKTEIIRKFADVLVAEDYKAFTLQEVYLGLLEQFALAFGMERFCIRSFDEFIEELRKRYWETGDIKSNPTNNFKLNLAVYALLNRAV